MQMHATGAAVRDIRSAIVGAYGSRFPTQTPTPQVPR